MSKSLKRRPKARKRLAGSLKTFSMSVFDWMKSPSELESWIGFEPISLCDFPFSRSWWEDPAAPNLGTPLTFRRDISLHLISNIPQNSVLWLDPSDSMKEKIPKTNRRRSIPEIHFDSQESSGKEPSKKKTPPKKKGTNGCFLPGPEKKEAKKGPYME